MICNNVVLYVSDVTEKKSEKTGKIFYSGKFSSGMPFDFPSFLLCGKVVEDGWYNCSVNITYDKQHNRNNIAVAVGDPVDKPF